MKEFFSGAFEKIKVFAKNYFFVVLLVLLFVGLWISAISSYRNKPITSIIPEATTEIVAPISAVEVVPMENMPTSKPAIIVKSTITPKPTATLKPTKIIKSTLAPIIKQNATVEKIEPNYEENTMDVVKLFMNALAFVAANVVMMGFISGILAYVKQIGWLSGGKLTALGFGLSFLFAIPTQIAVLPPNATFTLLQITSIILNATAIGLFVTGIYKSIQSAVGTDEVAKK
jgi:hypothetical protein